MTAAQRRTSSMRLRVGKWAGVWLGAIGAVAHQQIVASVVFARCPSHSVEFVTGMGLTCGLIALFGALVSWWTRQSLPTEEHASTSLRTDRFIATLAACFALFCLLFIVFATVAGWILRCERV